MFYLYGGPRGTRHPGLPECFTCVVHHVVLETLGSPERFVAIVAPVGVAL